jgi:hypothetical protein
LLRENARRAATELRNLSQTSIYRLSLSPGIVCLLTLVRIVLIVPDKKQPGDLIADTLIEMPAFLPLQAPAAGVTVGGTPQVLLVTPSSRSSQRDSFIGPTTGECIASAQPVPFGVSGQAGSAGSQPTGGKGGCLAR